MNDALFDVCVVGGCGRAGLPLAATLASAGLKVSIHDVDDRAVAVVRSGVAPFREAGLADLLKEVVGRSLEVRNDPELIAQAKIVIVIIGTPVDQHLNPLHHEMRRFFRRISPYLRDGQCLILRSTVFPGTTKKVQDLAREAGHAIHIAFCPERIAEGRAIEELRSLPQIVSGCDSEAVRLARELFERIAPSVVELEPAEAELAKMFCNAWRYVQFAAANQFFMIAADHGLDYYRIYDAITRDYPRLASLPGSGFAAGPCLFKDTMQLAAAHDNHFYLGHAAMLVNEGLPNFIVAHLKKSHALDRMTVGILGMAFKGGSDDSRESLSYKLRKILEYEAREVICSDEFIADDRFRPLDEVIQRSDLLIIGAPHAAYRTVGIPGSKRVVDIWNLRGNGADLR